MGFTFVHQILRLGRGEKLDELLDQLNPMPGHRVRLLNFAEEERARAQLNRIAPVRPPSASVLTAISQQPALTQSAEEDALECLAPACWDLEPPSQGRASVLTPISSGGPARRADSAGRVTAHATGAAVYAAAAAANGSSAGGTVVAARGMAPASRTKPRGGAAPTPAPGATSKHTYKYATAADAAAAAVAAAGVAAAAAGVLPSCLPRQGRSSEIGASASAARRPGAKGKPEGGAPLTRRAGAPPAHSRPALPPSAENAEEEEAAAMAFLRASWSREMLSAVRDDNAAAAAAMAVHAEVRGWRAEAAERYGSGGAPAGVLLESAAASVASLRATVHYEDDFEEDDGQEAEEDAAAAAAASPSGNSDKENAPATSTQDLADVQRQYLAAMQRRSATPPAAPAMSGAAPVPAPAPIQSLTPRGKGGVDASSEAALRKGKVLTPSTGKAERPRRRSMLANSVDTFAPQRGLLWQPDRKEVYTSVAFVLHKHIELNGRYLLVRTPQPLAATMSAAPDRHADVVNESPDSVLPAHAATESKGRSRSAVHWEEASDEGWAEAEGETPLPLHPLQQPDMAVSPDMPAAVRHAFLQGARSMNGLRYSVELSPVAEGAAEGRRRIRSARGSAEAPASPMKGRLAPEAAALYAEWADAEWAQPDEPEDEESYASDSEGGGEYDEPSSGDWDACEWHPSADTFAIFDESRTTIRRTDGSPAGPLLAPETAQRPPCFNEVSNYIRALCQSARMGAEASVVALAYIERLVSSAAFPLHGGTWRRCCLAAWLLASKMWDDECLESPQYAALFGYCADDVNALEQSFVEAINYRLALSSAEYARYYYSLRSICQTTTDDFPLRPLDAELDAKLERKAIFVNGAFRALTWGKVLDAADLSRSM